MAQNNPVNEASSFSTTNSANAPQNTNSTYEHTSTATGNTHPSSTGQKTQEAASGVKGLFAAAHGAGEKLRGEFNAGVDRTFDEKEGVAKNEAVARAGDGEMTTGRFTHSTKNREGAVPGDGERRRL